MSIQTVLAPQTWPFPASDLPQSACLVGGCVRDALLNRHTAYLDLDFVLPEAAVETARRVSESCNAGFVLLDAERDIARVVFPDATADFALQVGDSLEEDLQRRDYTINAIAYHPFSDMVIDPLKGRQDLDAGVLRMIAAKNLEEDPLRLLRAYRQAAQLGFTIEPQTQANIRQLTPQLKGIAAERIKVELSYLLSDSKATPWVYQLWQDGLLSTSFPHASSTSLAFLPAIDQAASLLQKEVPDLATAFHQELNERAQGKEAAQRTLLSTTKWVSLLSDSPTQAEITLKQMKFSRGEIHVITRVLNGWPRLKQLLQQEHCRRADQFYLFQDADTTFPAVVMVTLAVELMQQSAPGAEMLSYLQALKPWIAEYLNPLSALAHPQPLLSGSALMKSLHLSPGPEVGRLLSQLTLAQAEGSITTSEEALTLAQTLVSSTPSTAESG
ncbi:CCA tRNA nucleotidyltransferase [Acaryochloris sp. CCMEE 5410]|uniref:CCA tRNA nucleotidyltransferase n=1 Tax=Acaryochloris sp. CCMEE 5410 TaxID=310037 RepID=UPI00024848FF|nr:CCA tRNA nucleotidyltransferase [Acaryochloris sp. CCMEE 5410]KAI9132726.1 CCA tRNA nucleotidyltransferase [Acaryochloris sp. CCMEE 5410]